jgi:hypothetical protein
MLRMQEMTFPGFKFQKFYGGVLPQTPPPPFMHAILATHVAFSHCYPPVIYYLTERSLLKKCPPPTGKSLKKALSVMHESVARIEPTISEVKGACSDDCATRTIALTIAFNRTRSSCILYF